MRLGNIDMLTIVKHKDDCLKQADVITGLSALFPSTRLLNYSGDGVFRTPDTLRSIGVVVCSDCGHHTSDQKENCPKCGESIMVLHEGYIQPIPEQRQTNELVIGQYTPLILNGDWRWRKVDYVYKCHVAGRMQYKHNTIYAKSGMVYYFIKDRWWTQEEIDLFVKMNKQEDK